MAALTPPDVNRSSPKPAPAPVISSPNPPVSLAILVETALLTTRNRPMILSALQDVVHRLRPGDEAALLVFSNQLDFEQDLTANSALLTEAMESLHPKSGAALLEGVAFAAGHLKRIGKNETRVLLVISDGRSARLKPDAAPLSAQISGVRIDCIGLDVEDEPGRNLLQNLASGSGGRVVFVRGAEQFRMAAAQMASGIGFGPR
jgi:Mg-chelatase subunit ChlD